jgi:hypothetical protein
MTDNLPTTQNTGDLIFYQTEDGQTRVEVRFEGDTVWLSQAQMVELFQTTKQNISLHINNIFEENELQPEGTVKEYLTVQTEGKREVKRSIEHYNLDVIISLGYRVKSHRGTQFRIWATQHLREYLVKGFTMDDERLKQAGGGNYFDELLARIRDIRSSEKVFWKKVLNIYATSIDYDPNTDTSQKFFKIVQNKMHWAAHGHTAAEIIAKRADANKLQMGLTSHSGKTPKRSDVGIAKNYLNEDELDTLNRIVSVYLEFAELQAKNRRPMHMNDWITKLDDFLRFSDRDILTHAGKIKHEDAITHANAEFDKFKERQLEEKSVVEVHFEQSLKNLEQIELTVSKAKPTKKKNRDM